MATSWKHCTRKSEYFTEFFGLNFRLGLAGIRTWLAFILKCLTYWRSHIRGLLNTGCSDLKFAGFGLFLLSRSTLKPLISLDLVSTKLYCFRTRLHCYYCLYNIFSAITVRGSKALRAISFPELRSPWPAVGKRELWEHLFQACATDAEFGYFHCYLKMDAPRALVSRPLVKGNEALGTRLRFVATRLFWGKKVLRGTLPKSSWP